MHIDDMEFVSSHEFFYWKNCDFSQIPKHLHAYLRMLVSDDSP